MVWKSPICERVTSKTKIYLQNILKNPLKWIVTMKPVNEKRNMETGIKTKCKKHPPIKTTLNTPKGKEQWIQPCNLINNIFFAVSI